MNPEHFPEYREDEDGSIDHAEDAEKTKCKCFGDRIWGWADPPEVSPRKWCDAAENPEKLADLYEKPIEEWPAEVLARYLYLRKHGLFERASKKMTHILSDLHASIKSHKHVTVEDPVVGAYTFWDDFGDEPIPEAGWHTWEPGADSEKAMQYMTQPFTIAHDKRNVRTSANRHKVFVCGEAYSSEQGWIEGALKSVERVMAKLDVGLLDDVYNHIGVPRPGIRAGGMAIKAATVRRLRSVTRRSFRFPRRS